MATEKSVRLFSYAYAYETNHMRHQGSLKKRTDYGAAFAASGVTTYYCSQRGCQYMGHVSVDFVWKAVMKDERLGLKVRWAFLGKA